MDDDQSFVQRIFGAIEDAPEVDYRMMTTDETDEGRNMTIWLELYAGDQYVITIREINE